MALAHGLNRLSPKLESGNFLLYFFSLFEKKKKKKKGRSGRRWKTKHLLGWPIISRVIIGLVGIKGFLLYRVREQFHTRSGNFTDVNVMKPGENIMHRGAERPFLSCEHCLRGHVIG